MSGEYRGVVCHVLPTMVLQMFKEVNVIVLWSQYHNENRIDHLDISDFDSKSIRFTEIISLSFNDNSISIFRNKTGNVQKINNHDEYTLYCIAPRRWPEEYRTCGGTRQSPIDIQINQVVVDDSLEPFDLRDLENLNNIRMTMKNNGHTGMLAFLYSCQIYIDSGKYIFVNVCGPTDLHNLN